MHQKNQQGDTINKNDSLKSQEEDINYFFEKQSNQKENLNENSNFTQNSKIENDHVNQKANDRKENIFNVSIIFIRLCVEVGIFTLPYFMKVYGGLVGIILFFTASFVNYLCYTYLAEVGNETNTNNFVDLVKLLTPGWVLKVFKVTYFIDLVTGISFPMVVLYNLSLFLMSFTGFVPKEWYQNVNTMELKHYYGPVFLSRFVYFVVIVTCMLPFILIKDYSGLQRITKYYILVLGVLCVYIFSEMYFFREHLKKNRKLNVNYIYSTPNEKWVESFYGVLISYYAQQFFFNIRNHLKNPSTKRLKKVTGYSMSTLCLVFILIGKVGLSLLNWKVWLGTFPWEICSPPNC